jgi:hypothetical protein
MAAKAIPRLPGASDNDEVTSSNLVGPSEVKLAGGAACESARLPRRRRGILIARLQPLPFGVLTVRGDPKVANFPIRLVNHQN